MTFGGTRPLVEDNLLWKTTFGGRRPSVEDDFRWETHSVEDNLLWKTTFEGWQSLVEDTLQWRKTFGGIWPSGKTTFARRPGGGRPSVQDDFRWKMILTCCLFGFAAFLVQNLKIEKSKILRWDTPNLRGPSELTGVTTISSLSTLLHWEYPISFENWYKNNTNLSHSVDEKLNYGL